MVRILIVTGRILIVTGKILIISLKFHIKMTITLKYRPKLKKIEISIE